MLYLSKSKYCQVRQCPKLLWLAVNKPDAETMDAAREERFETGNEVGDLAMGLFGDFVEVTKRKDDGKLDLAAMIEATSEEMARGTSVICEASFSYEGLYCAVDILKKEADGWAIYEVKSSTRGDKAVYITDVAYQKYVLEHCGVNVVGTYTVVLNNQYVFEKELDLNQLFLITDVSALLPPETAKIEENLRIAESVLLSDTEPVIDLSDSCNEPYKCGFFGYCTRALPKPSVFDLYKMNFSKKLSYYRQGKVGFEDIAGDAGIDNDIQRRQIDHALHDRGIYVDKDGIRAFLSTLSYPLYFLDFETFQTLIPEFDGTRPYMQIPFQYSLHYYETDGDPLKHKEFLAESGSDPRREIAERLCADIPKDACVLAFNMTFERTCIKALAAAFPDLAEHLMSIHGNIKDLIEPFRAGSYYTREIGSSFSIKSILPAMFPNDPELDYHALDGVHNGSEAMTIFPKMQFMSPEERERTRHNLLEYCKLDTLAMVKVWEELVRVSR